MTIKVKFFASLREQIGHDSVSLNLETPCTITDIWKQATQNTAMPVNTLSAINMEYVGLDEMAQSGDEVAFFPPVTGG